MEEATSSTEPLQHQQFKEGNPTPPSDYYSSNGRFRPYSALSMVYHPPSDGVRTVPRKIHIQALHLDTMTRFDGGDDIGVITCGIDIPPDTTISAKRGHQPARGPARHHYSIRRQLSHPQRYLKDTSTICGCQPTCHTNAVHPNQPEKISTVPMPSRTDKLGRITSFEFTRKISPM